MLFTGKKASFVRRSSECRGRSQELKTFPRGQTPAARGAGTASGRAPLGAPRPRPTSRCSRPRFKSSILHKHLRTMAPLSFETRHSTSFVSWRCRRRAPAGGRPLPHPSARAALPQGGVRSYLHAISGRQAAGSNPCRPGRACRQPPPPPPGRPDPL